MAHPGLGPVGEQLGDADAHDDGVIDSSAGWRCPGRRVEDAYSATQNIEQDQAEWLGPDEDGSHFSRKH